MSDTNKYPLSKDAHMWYNDARSLQGVGYSPRQIVPRDRIVEISDVLGRQIGLDEVKVLVTSDGNNILSCSHEGCGRQVSPVRFVDIDSLIKDTKLCHRLRQRGLYWLKDEIPMAGSFYLPLVGNDPYCFCGPMWSFSGNLNQPADSHFGERVKYHGLGLTEEGFKKAMIEAQDAENLVLNINRNKGVTIVHPGATKIRRSRQVWSNGSWIRR